MQDKLYEDAGLDKDYTSITSNSIWEGEDSPSSLWDRLSSEAASGDKLSNFKSAGNTKSLWGKLTYSEEDEESSVEGKCVLFPLHSFFFLQENPPKGSYIFIISHPSALTDHGTHETYHVCVPGECRYGGAVISHASRSTL